MILDFLKSSYTKVKSALAKTRSVIGQRIRTLFQGKINEESLEDLEQILYEADIGVQMSRELTEKVRKHLRENPSADSEHLLEVIRNEIITTLTPAENPKPSSEIPHVILIVGVNGNGKTTSVAKLAKRLQSSGKKVLVGAADTFRAAAIEQLSLWAERLGIDIVKGNPNSDPAAVAFDAVSAAKARGADTVIIDTAGRLHTKTALMHELEKIKRSCQKISPHAPHETFLVLDATTGQNAVDQAKTFHKFTPITGLILTKLDGSAKGGIVINIQKQLGIPVKFIGIGEGIEDLEIFDPESYVKALFE